MLSKLKSGKKLVGVKQSGRAIRDGSVACAYVSKDADPMVIGPIEQLCQDTRTPIVFVDTMKQLGDACDIAVGAAVAVLVK